MFEFVCLSKFLAETLPVAFVLVRASQAGDGNISGCTAFTAFDGEIVPGGGPPPARATHVVVLDHCRSGGRMEGGCDHFSLLECVEAPVRGAVQFPFHSVWSVQPSEAADLPFSALAQKAIARVVAAMPMRVHSARRAMKAPNA